MSMTIEGRPIERILVVGYGLTGRAVVEHALRRGVRVSLSEFRCLPEADRVRLAEQGVEFEDGGHTERYLRGTDLMVLSPGVPLAHPLVRAGRRVGIRLLSEIDLAAVLAPAVPLIAVTGTNGKGTTVMLIEELLRMHGLRACIGGNIGTPFISLLDEPVSCDAFVIEVSSYQLESCRLLHPTVAILLNLTPDHLGRHGTMEAYAHAKGRLFQNQTETDVAVLPRALGDRFPQGRARRVFFDDPFPPLPKDARDLPEHRRANLAAAVAAAGILVDDLEPSALSMDALSPAFALPHRMQVIGSIHDVRVISDSKATNADATIAALRAVKGPIVLLLGGRHKGLGYDALAREIARPQVRHVVVFGEAADDLTGWLREAGVVPAQVDTLEQAVDAALGIASRGDTLLFSPACSSFDAYESFEARGDAFLDALRARRDFVPFEHAGDMGGREGHVSASRRP